MKILVLIVISAFLVSPLTVHAYLDPGTGSLIIQSIIAGIAMAGMAFKMYWRRISSFLTVKFRKAGQDTSTKN